MQEKSVLLTPNNRLCRCLQYKFCTSSNLTKTTSWYSPSIFPLNTWLKNCWYECQDPRVLLSKQQEKLLWYKIISEALGENSTTLASLALKAHELTHNWCIGEINNAYYTEDIIVFQRIYKKFKEYCKNKQLVTYSELSTLIIPYISTYGFTKITFAGFDEYPPQLQLLINAIENTGCEILKVDPNNYHNSKQNLLGFDKQSQEIITSAKWAKKILNEYPDKNIGIVIPNLVPLRSKIQQIFSEIFHDSKNINISVGIPLNTIPIVKLALELLTISEPFDLTAINKILASPYIVGAEEERPERALFRQQLALLEHPQLLYLIDIKHLATNHTLNLPLIIKALQNTRELLVKTKNKTLYNSEWAQIFVKILHIFGWPGEANLTDLESTAVQYFLKTIEEVATTNFILGKILYKNSLQNLQQLVANTTIPSDSGTNAPINIFGMLEAAGINFDYLWVMGLDQENYPPAPQPNPFIPIKIQRELFLPHSSAERELHFTQILIDRYKRSAKNIVFSYVKQGENHKVAPSTLIADIPEISADELNLEPITFFIQKIYSSKQIETLSNDAAPNLTPNEAIHPSSRLIEQQSLCPFRAFMEFRLLTKEPQKMGPGINKITRGVLIHGTLEKIWQKIQTQENLCLFNPNLLQKLIEESIGSLFNILKIPLIFQRIERQCLTSLITKWLEIEKTREPFQIISTEKSMQINLASMTIKLRIDRIDQLASGDILLIDYKTGKNLPAIYDWFGDRPKAPQLPLYSLALDSIQGLALAQINIDSLKFKEINTDYLINEFNKIANNKNNSKTIITWDELREHWHKVLTKIVEDFIAGQAPPTPISPQACKQCGFSSVCRTNL